MCDRGVVGSHELEADAVRLNRSVSAYKGKLKSSQASTQKYKQYEAEVVKLRQKPTFKPWNGRS